MPIASTTNLQLFDPGWQNPKSIPVSGAVLSRSVNQPHVFSAIATIDDVLRLARTDVIGAWCFWNHPTEGPFAGIIDDDPSDIGNGTIALSATGLGHALLIDRITPVLIQPDTGHAGALAKRALSFAQTADPLPFRAVTCDESGPTVLVEWRGESIYDVLQNLARQTDQEWDVICDSERNLDFVWREQIGVDQRDRILISEGYQVSSGRIDHSRLSVVNDITGISATDDFEKSAFARIENETSRARYGRRQEVRRYESAVSKLSVRARVRSDIRESAFAPSLVTVSLAALNTINLYIRHGDTVRYWSRARNRELDLRVMSTTVRDGEREIAGIATEVGIPPVLAPFTPDILSGLSAWYDATDTSTLTLSVDQVTQWRDKSGSGLHMIPPAAGAITYVPNSKISKPSILTDATAYLSTTSNLNLSSSSGATIFLVAKHVGAGTETALRFPHNVVGIPVDPDFSLDRDASDKLFLNVRSAGATPSSFQHGNTWGSTFHLVTAIVNLAFPSNEANLYDNGTTNGTTRPTNGNNTGNLASGKLAIFPNFNYGEVIIFNRALSANELDAIEGYLRSKWGF